MNLEAYQTEGVKMEWLEKYLVLLQEHIHNVQIAGRMLGISEIQLSLHDRSKYTNSEFAQYARQFCGDKGDPKGWAIAWCHHQNFNPHHWEHFITRSDHSKGLSGAVNGALPMPVNYIREMVADWMGASKSYLGIWSIHAWTETNLPKMNLHPTTRAEVLMILEEVEYGEKLEKILEQP